MKAQFARIHGSISLARQPVNPSSHRSPPTRYFRSFRTRRPRFPREGDPELCAVAKPCLHCLDFTSKVFELRQQLFDLHHQIAGVLLVLVTIGSHLG